MGVQVGGLDMVTSIVGDRGGGWVYTLAVPLLAAIAGDRGAVGVQVSGLDVVTLLGAIAGLPLYKLVD